MQNTPKSLRLHVVISGRANSGKSTLLNAVAGQDVALTSPHPGTTTDAVEKAMELPPLGPVLLVDTAGLDDVTELGEMRMARSRKFFERADVILLVVEPGVWGETEESVAAAAKMRGAGCVAVVNKCDIKQPDAGFLKMLEEKTGFAPLAVSAAASGRDDLLGKLKQALLSACPEDFVNPPPLLSDLVGLADAVVMITPIDKQAPKGRLILPQVQTIRDALDAGALPLACRDGEYPAALAALRWPPALVVCDSQVVAAMAGGTPQGVPCTTFSILFSRLKCDIAVMAAGAAAIGKLTPESRVLIAEGCTHHASEDDIGRVKIPRRISERLGFQLAFDVVSGHDWPDDAGSYDLVIHCGGCMLNRRENLRRMAAALSSGAAVTNYGMALSYCSGVLERVLSPFPDALAAYRKAEAANV